MAAVKALHQVEAAIKRSSFTDIVSSTFRSGHDARTPSDVSAKAAEALLRIKELLASDGITIAVPTKQEVSTFVRDAHTAADGHFTALDYQALVEMLTRYAALKARHNVGKRWGLGCGLSAVGAMALTAAVFTSAGLLLVAAPAGAAIGAVAAAADGSKARRRDRRTAKQGSTAGNAAAAAAVTASTAASLPEIQEADAPAGPEGEEAASAAVVKATAAGMPETAAAAAPDAGLSVAAAAAAADASAVAAPAVPTPAAPAPAHGATSSGNSSPRGSSGDELVSAVVELMAPADEAADTPKKATPAAAVPPALDTAAVVADDLAVPAPVPCESPFSVAAKGLDSSSSRAYSDDTHPALAPVRISISTLPVPGPRASVDSAALPPKPLKKSKSLKKTMKSLKKAFSLKDKDASGVKDATKHRAGDADSDSPLAPPVPPRRSGSFFRRSSSDVGEDGGGEGVERSKGSATIKRMVEGIRRSFSLDRPSMDLVQPKKARKETAA